MLSIISAFVLLSALYMTYVLVGRMMKQTHHDSHGFVASALWALFYWLTH